MKYLRHALISSACLSFPLVAHAQTIPNTPQAQPSRIQQQLRIEQPQTVLEDTEILTVPEEDAITTADGQTKFELKSVAIEGNTEFSTQELEQLYSRYLNTAVTLVELRQIANRITQYYRNNGRILSRAILPPQHIKDGRVLIRIVEGYVDRIIFEGSSPVTPLIKSYAEKIRENGVLNTVALERYLLLIQDLPGMTARSVLRPSPTVVGASDLIITMDEDHIEGALSVTNRGTRYIGPWQGGVTLNANNIFGVHDRTQFRAITSDQPDELQFFQMTHDEQIGTEGTRLTFGISRTKTRPGFRLDGFNIEGRDTLLSGQVYHPFLRSRRENLYGRAQFDIRHTESDTQGTPIYADRLYVARASGAYDLLDEWNAVNRMELEVSKGLGWKDNPDTPLRSRAGGQTEFWKVFAQGSRLQPLNQSFSLFVAAKGQLANAALLTAEQFGIGGADFGSAYDPSEITGDSGAAGRAELQYNSDYTTNYVQTIQLYGFYDAGRVYTRNPAAGIRDEVSISSAGVGTRFNVFQNISGSVELAVPLTKPVLTAQPNNGNDPRIFASLSYRF